MSGRAKEGIMKRWAVVLLLAVFVFGEISMNDWRKIADKDAFIDDLGSAICTEMECEEGEIEVIGAGKRILFFWRCLDSGKESSKTNDV